MRWSAVALAASTLSTILGCGGGVTLAIDSDRVIPSELDGLCVGVADRDLGGGSFGRRYRLVERLAQLPQTLAVEAGSADRATAWAAGTRAGVVVTTATTTIDFDGDVALHLDRCPAARAGALVASGPIAGPGLRVVASLGQGGAVAVAIDADAAAVIDVVAGAITSDPIAGAGGGAVVAADLDGDCDDDLAIARGAAVELWWRRGRSFVAGPTLATGADALAAADVDSDGDLDLAVGRGAAIAVWRGDGVGGFAPAAGGVDARGAVTAVSALGFGDLDGDGHADLVVGQAGAPTVALLGDPTGTGVLTAAAAVLPATARAVVDVAVGDLDGDRDDDVVIALASGGPRAFINRGGLLEDQSFVRLPASVAAARATAIGDWDGDCAPDLVVVGATSTALRGGTDGALTIDGALPAAAAVVTVDLDDDGALDRVVVGAAGATWVHR